MLLTGAVFGLLGFHCNIAHCIPFKALIMIHGNGLYLNQSVVWDLMHATFTFTKVVLTVFLLECLSL